MIMRLPMQIFLAAARSMVDADVQRGAAVALVEVEAPPESIWRARIEARSAEVAAGGLDSHKPSWDALHQLVAGFILRPLSHPSCPPAGCIAAGINVVCSSAGQSVNR